MIKEKNIVKHGLDANSSQQKVQKIEQTEEWVASKANSVNDNTITIYTDGASSGNPGPGGIGIFLKFREHEKSISESIGKTTNNIAELTAIKRALLELKRSDLPVRLYTDSSYAIGILTKRWKATKNQELVAEIKDLIKKFKDIKFIKVEGHAGIAGNEKADALATEAIKNRASAKLELNHYST